MRTHLPFISVTQKSFSFLQVNHLTLKKIFYFIFLFLSAVSYGQTQVLTTPGAGSWRVPCGVTSVTVELWGAGGGGGGSNTNNSGGSGGGSGGYSIKTFPVVAGELISYSIGKGGTGGVANSGKGGDGEKSTISAMTANGGGGGAGNGGTIGAGGTASGGTTNTTGNSGTKGGSSGGSGGPAPNGGLGGVGGANVNGGNGVNPGGGGGGGEYGDSSNRSGGAGGDGQIRITYTPAYCYPTSANNTYHITNMYTAGAASNIANTPTGSGTVASGYSNYCNVAVTAVNGTSFVVYYKGNNNHNFGWGIWVDWNKNGIFESTEKVYTSSSTMNGGTAMIAVPSTQAAGNYSMRILADYNNSSGNDPCVFTGTTKQGEAEDYTLTVQNGSPCASPGAPSELKLTRSGAKVNGSFTGSSTTPSGYLIIRSTNATAPTLTNGTSYITGSTTAGYEVLRGTEASNITTAFTDTISYGMYYYYVFAYHSQCIGAPFFSSGINTSLLYCDSVSTSSGRYISNVKFLGTLNEDTSNPSVYGASGYSNYTALLQKAKQIPGGVINVNVSISTATGPVSSKTKAWVDWNKNSSYEDASELVFDMKGLSSANVTFGYIVPLGTAPGIYTIRIRSSSVSSFSACGSISNGETEDYSFEVINDCATKIVSVNATKQCGSGSVQLTATATPDAISYRWYSSEFGSAIAGETGNVYTTPVLVPGTYYYYVTAFNGSCESTFRTPVKVVVSPIPTIQFTQNSPDICGLTDSILISSSGDKEEFTLMEEKFEDRVDNPIKFENIFEGDTDGNAAWQWRDSPFLPQDPPYTVMRPAISSGYNNGKFANIISDVRQKTNILNHYVLKNNLNSTGLSDLKLDFDLYYFSEEDLITKNYLKVQYSIDGGVNWKDLKTYIEDVGIPSRFFKESIPLPKECENQTQLKIRYSLFALGSSGEWMADIVGIDNLRLYGNKELPSKFTWAANTALFDSACTGTPLAGGSPSICIKPPAADLETKTTFTVTATATLSNGCNVSKTISIDNNNKIWNRPGETQWELTRWKPVSAVPDQDKCVIVKTPLFLKNTSGVAKNIIVEKEGQLTIEANRSLTLTDYIINRAEAKSFMVSSDANLIQTNDDVINTDEITVRREANMKRLDYTYWGSPVISQNLKAFSPKTLSNRFYTYDESDDFFKNIIPEGNIFVPGKGYAIRSPNTFPADNLTYQKFDGTFVGVPNNGIGGSTLPRRPDPLLFSLKKTHNGYNLIANPYASNIDFKKLHDLNIGKIDFTAYFWTNVNSNPVMQGSNYPNGGYVSNYATLNGIAGVPATYAETPQNPNTGGLLQSKTPNQFIKVGQGFIVRSLVDNQNLVFNNSVRTADNSSVFFNSRNASTEQIDRYWIQLTTPLGVISTAAVGYKEGATNGFDSDYDAPLMGLGVDAVFTNLDSRKLAIQGRQYPLSVGDVVQLGTNHHVSGVHRISVPIAEGVFQDGQNIFLRDHETGEVANLSESYYDFSAEKGLTEGRFELFYQPRIVLETGDSVRENLVVYRDGDAFVVKSKVKKITGVEVYDSSGRLVYKVSPDDKKVVLPAQSLISGVYVLKINQNGEISTRKMMK